MTANSNRTAPITPKSLTSQLGPDRYAIRMNATNQVSSPITASVYTSLFFWLVNRASQTPFPFNHLPNFDNGKSPAGLTEPFAEFINEPRHRLRENESAEKNDNRPNQPSNHTL